MTGQTQRPPAPGNYPPVAADLVEQGLRLAESGRLCGEWDQWFTVQLDAKHSLRFQVLARGIKLLLFELRLHTTHGRIVRARHKTAEGWLEPRGDAWHRAVAVLEAAPELAPRIDTRGD
jgi:hypothetical protein